MSQACSVVWTGSLAAIKDVAQLAPPALGHLTKPGLLLLARLSRHALLPTPPFHSHHLRHAALPLLHLLPCNSMKLRPTSTFFRCWSCTHAKASTPIPSMVVIKTMEVRRPSGSLAPRLWLRRIQEPTTRCCSSLRQAQVARKEAMYEELQEQT